MSFKETHEKITNSEVFKNFIKENSEAELVAGFFILDFISNDAKKSIDYRQLWRKMNDHLGERQGK